MKKLKLILVSFLLLQLNLFATDSSNVETNAEYQNAFKYYESKNYKEAFEILRKLIEIYPSNENVNFYYARAAFELQQYQTALIVYDRLLINNPMHHRARLEYARTLFMLKQYNGAKAEFEQVLTYPVPDQVRKNIENFLAQIEEKQKRYFINNFALFGLEFDDNIDNATYEYYNNLLTDSVNSNRDKKSDTSFKNTLVNNLILPFKSNNQFTWENTVVSYLQRYQTHNDNDIFLLSWSTGLGYTGNNFKNTTSLLYDNIWESGDKSFYIYGLRDNFIYQLDQNKQLSLTLQYKKKKNIKEADHEKNSTTKNLNLAYNLLLSKTDKFSVFGGVEVTRKEKGTRTDISKDVYSSQIAYEKVFLSTYSANVSYQYNKSNYKVASQIGTTTYPKREDKQHSANLRLSKYLNKTQNIFLNLSHIDNSSNNNIYSYKKNTINLNYGIKF